MDDVTPPHLSEDASATLRTGKRGVSSSAPAPAPSAPHHAMSANDTALLIELPPAVIAFSKAQRAAAARSRFPLVRSSAFALVGFTDPLVSASSLAVGGAAYAACAIGGLPLAYVVTSLAFAALLGGGAIAAANAVLAANAGGSMPLQFLPLPPLRADGAALARGGAAAAAAASSAIDGAGTLLRWSDSAASARALAYVWLAMIWAPALLAPGVAMAVAFAACLAATAYLQLQREVDVAYTTHVLVNVKRAAAAAEGVRIAAVDAARRNQQVALGAAGGFVVLSVYFFWRTVPFAAVCTFLACTVAAYDAMLSIASAPINHSRVD